MPAASSVEKRNRLLLWAKNAAIVIGVVSVGAVVGAWFAKRKFYEYLTEKGRQQAAEEELLHELAKINRELILITCTLFEGKLLFVIDAHFDVRKAWNNLQAINSPANEATETAALIIASPNADSIASLTKRRKVDAWDVLKVKSKLLG